MTSRRDDLPADPFAAEGVTVLGATAWAVVDDAYASDGVAGVRGLLNGLADDALRAMVTLRAARLAAWARDAAPDPGRESRPTGAALAWALPHWKVLGGAAVAGADALAAAIASMHDDDLRQLVFCTWVVGRGLDAPPDEDGDLE